MNSKVIIHLIKGLGIPSRLLEILSCYLMSLMIPTDKHTQVNAEKISGKDSSLFSRLLKNNLGLTGVILNRAARRAIQALMKKRRPLFEGAPWKIAIIIDATLHERSSEKIENSQKLNHGGGWVIGHQWTNIVILINDKTIPLPPIPFFTKKESEIREKKYLTSNEAIVNYLKTMPLKDILGLHSQEEIVVLLDAGYDCKEIQNTILSRGWDFVASIKQTRSMRIEENDKWEQTQHYFGDGRRPWKILKIKIKDEEGKSRMYSVKQRETYIKGLSQKMRIVASKRNHDKKVIFLLCSNLEIDIKKIIKCYSRRWRIEIFHREIKSHLGLQDCGVSSFDSLNSHVHFVYLSYILLKEFGEELKVSGGIKFLQEKLFNEIQISQKKSLLSDLTKINGKEKVKTTCRSDIERLEAA